MLTVREIVTSIHFIPLKLIREAYGIHALNTVTFRKAVYSCTDFAVFCETVFLLRNSYEDINGMGAGCIPASSSELPPVAPFFFLAPRVEMRILSGATIFPEGVTDG